MVIKQLVKEQKVSLCICLCGGGWEGSGRLLSWCYIWLLLLLGLKTTLALAMVFSEQVRHGCTSSGSEVFSTAVRVCDQTKGLLR